MGGDWTRVSFIPTYLPNLRRKEKSKFVQTFIDQLRDDFREPKTRPSTSSADNICTINYIFLMWDLNPQTAQTNVPMLSFGTLVCGFESRYRHGCL